MVRLLDLGIDPELRDRQGKRAVDRAAEAGRWSLVGALDRAYPLPSAVSWSKLKPCALRWFSTSMISWRARVPKATFGSV